MKALDIQPYQATDDYIVLIRYDLSSGDRSFCNLLRCSRNGEDIWIAELPDVGYNNDAYVGFVIKSWGEIEANTFSGYRVWIAGETGKINNADFTK